MCVVCLALTMGLFQLVMHMYNVYVSLFLIKLFAKFLVINYLRMAYFAFESSEDTKCLRLFRVGGWLYLCILA